MECGQNLSTSTVQNVQKDVRRIGCPLGAERLGYGGEGHASIDLAVDAFDSAAFLRKWAQDWCDMQDVDGRINHSAPTMGGGGGPAWSGFILALPWEIYLAYGDLSILRQTFPFAKKWLAYLARHIGADNLLAPVSPGKWNCQNGDAWLFLGDWIAPGRNEASDSSEALLFNNCYHVYVLGLACQMARLLGEEAEAQMFQDHAAILKQAIHRRFFVPATGAYLDTKQVHCVMPMVSGVVENAYVPALEQNLENEILKNCGGHFDTGMHGTYFLTKYLCDRHRSDLIFTCATQTTYPGYGYLLANGETAWPEEWSESHSHLHGTLNGIGGWFQRGLAGICVDPEGAGYRKFYIRPEPLGDLAWVNAYHNCPYGRITCNWRWEDETFRLEVGVPPNTTATIRVPGEKVQLRPTQASGKATIIYETKEATIFEVEPGSYILESSLASRQF